MNQVDNLPPRKLKKIVPIIVLCLLYLGFRHLHRPHANRFHPPTATDNKLLPQLFNRRQSNVQVQGEGVIVKVLPDDQRGRRHQRLLVKVNGRQTLLIAHNLDLAPRVENPVKGEKISFAGEYEWNRQGGIIHWTHRDPTHRHPDGWLQYQGRKYQ